MEARRALQAEETLRPDGERRWSIFKKLNEVLGKRA